MSLAEIDRVRNYGAVRARLRRPANSVEDPGIDLKRKKFTPRVIEIIPEPLPEIVYAPVEIPAFLPDRAAEILIVEDINICARFPISIQYQEITQIKPVARNPTISEIISAVSEYFNLKISVMLSDSRRQRYCRPRQIGMFLSREMTGRSYPYIAHRFKRFDHTTSYHACQRIADLCLTDEQVAFDVAMIEAAILD